MAVRGKPTGIDPRTRLTDATRCVHKTREGTRCQNGKMPGIDFCTTHVRNRPKLIEKSERYVIEQDVERELRKEMSRMERFTTPIPIDDPEARGDVALVTELRRTVQHIRIFDEWIAELAEGSLGWGKTTFERKISTGAYEQDDSHTVSRFEARANIIYEMQMRERQHLVNIAKVWITAGFKQRELDLHERQVAGFNAAQMEILTALGHDVTAPEVRSVVNRALLGLTPKAMEMIES
jgi:hypothetical protein